MEIKINNLCNLKCRCVILWTIPGGRIGSSIVSHWKRRLSCADAVRSWDWELPYGGCWEPSCTFWENLEKLCPISNVLIAEMGPLGILHTTKFWTCCLKWRKTLNKIYNQMQPYEYKDGGNSALEYWQDLKVLL